MLSRIGIIGDVHGEAARLQAALPFLSTRVERILCVGDVVDGGGGDEKCCDLLRTFEVATVRGNHDRWLLNGEMRDRTNAISVDELSADAVEWLRNLPRTRSFETDAGRLLLCHGVGENDMNKLTPDDYGYALEFNDELQNLIRAKKYRFAVGGHTHRRMTKRFGGLTWINPGALMNNHDLSFALADFKRGTIEFYGFAGEEIAGLIERVALP